MTSWSETIILCISSSIDNFSVGLTFEISKKRIRLVSNLMIACLNSTVQLVTMLIGGVIQRYLDPDICSTLGASIFIILGLKELVSYFWCNDSNSNGISEESLQGGVANPLSSSLMDDDDALQASSTRRTSSNTSTFHPNHPFPAQLERSLQAAESLVEGIESIVLSRPTSVDHTFQALPNGDDIEHENSSEDKLLIPSMEIVSLRATVVIGLGLCFTNVASGVAAGLDGFDVTTTTIGVFIASFLMLLAGQLVGRFAGLLIPEFIVPVISGCGLLTLGILDLPYTGVDS